MPTSHTQSEKITVKGVSDFIEQISKLELAQNSSRFFRGHANCSYELIPSIYRGSIIDNENIMINDILSSCPNDFSQDKSIFEKLTRLQHYGFPTRLLDITTNPLVALYFAVAGSEHDKDGEIIIFDIPKNDIKYSNSDTVSIISATSLLPSSFSIREIDEDANTKKQAVFDENILRLAKEHIALIQIKQLIENQLPQECQKLKFTSRSQNLEDVKLEIINQHDDIISLVHFIRDEKPGFRNAIKLDDLQKILCVIPKKNNIRVSNQQGAFFLFGIGDTKTDYADISQQDIKITKKIIIDKDEKENILKDLENLGISQQFLFPELEKQSEYIKQKYSKP